MVYLGDPFNRLYCHGCLVQFLVRRKFVEALPSDKELWETSAAAEGVKHCDRLFTLEREFDGKDKDGNKTREPLSPEENTAVVMKRSDRFLMISSTG